MSRSSRPSQIVMATSLSGRASGARSSTVDPWRASHWL
jgi:hypothetical protein